MADLIYELNGLGNGLITGLQGAGKTHFTMTQCKWLVENTDIEVYLINVDGVTLQSPSFHLADASFNWITDAPKNSIIIYDEAGTIERFSNSSKTINSDPQVAELTKLRHHGKQVFFIAQDPSLLHPAVRKLMVKHLHFSNPYNDPKKTHCFVFPQVIDRIDGTSKAWQKNAIEQFDHELDPEIYPLYKSVSDGANHVKKKQKNAKAQRVFIAVAVILVIALLALIGAVIMGLSWYKGYKVADEPKTPKPTEFITKPVQVTVASAVNPTSNSEVNDRIKAGNEQLKRELELYKERLPQDYQILASNDDLRVASAIQFKNVCKAYNVKGDLLNVSDEECRYYLAQSGRMIHKGSDSRVITQYPQNEVASATVSSM